MYNMFLYNNNGEFALVGLLRHPRCDIAYIAFRCILMKRSTDEVGIEKVGIDNVGLTK